MLKKLMIGTAVAAVFAVPAMAQSYNPAMGTGNVTAQIQAPAYNQGYQAYAYAPSRSYTSAYGPVGVPFDVIGALNPFAYNSYAYEPAPHRGYHGRVWHRY